MQPGYQQQPVGATVVVQQPTVLVGGVVRFGQYSQAVVCPNCQQTGKYLIGKK